MEIITAFRSGTTTVYPVVGGLRTYFLRHDEEVLFPVDTLGDPETRFGPVVENHVPDPALQAYSVIVGGAKGWINLFSAELDIINPDDMTDAGLHELWGYGKYDKETGEPMNLLWINSLCDPGQVRRPFQLVSTGFGGLDADHIVIWERSPKDSTIVVEEPATSPEPSSKGKFRGAAIGAGGPEKDGRFRTGHEYNRDAKQLLHARVITPHTAFEMMAAHGFKFPGTWFHAMLPTRFHKELTIS